MAAAAAGCRADGAPRRVPDDGAPCSAVIPGSPTSRDETLQLGTVAATERAWSFRQPDRSVDPPNDFTTYVVRRGAVLPDAPLRDQALLDAAAARVARGIELQDVTKPTVAKVSTGAGDAVELRWTTGRFHNATRLHLIPRGYCEVTILGASTEADIASYFASVQVGTGAKP